MAWEPRFVSYVMNKFMQPHRIICRFALYYAKNLSNVISYYPRLNNAIAISAPIATTGTPPLLITFCSWSRLIICMDE